jgi:hypothetical protein
MTMNPMFQRRTTRLTFAGLSASMCVAVVACSATGPGGSSVKDTSDKQLVIGHSYQDLSSPYFADERKVEKALAAKNGYSYVATQASNNPATQLNDIENLISRKVNLLVIDAIALGENLIPGLGQLHGGSIRLGCGRLREGWLRSGERQHGSCEQTAMPEDVTTERDLLRG